MPPGDKDFLGRLARAEERDNKKKTTAPTPEKLPNRFRAQSVERKEEASPPAQQPTAKKAAPAQQQQQQQQPTKKGKASSSPPPPPKNGIAAGASELDELRDKMASGHMLTADELAMLEAAAAVDDKPSGKAAPPAKKRTATPPPAKPESKPAAAAAAAAPSTKGSRDSSELDELRDKMASGHMLTADELAMLEAAAAVDDKPSGKAAAAGKDPPAKGGADAKKRAAAEAKPATRAKNGQASAGKATATPAAAVPALPVNTANPPDGSSLDLNDIALAESIFLAEMASSFGGETLSRVNGLIAEARRQAQAEGEAS